jgi:hypothetical protein
VNIEASVMNPPAPILDGHPRFRLQVTREVAGDARDRLRFRIAPGAREVRPCIPFAHQLSMQKEEILGRLLRPHFHRRARRAESQTLR